MLGLLHNLLGEITKHLNSSAPEAGMVPVADRVS
jgi:hypothetical protein